MGRRRMRGYLKVLGVGAACAACCALPLAVPALGLAGASLGFSTWIVLGAIGLALGVGLALQRRRAQAVSCKVDGSCGCKEGNS